MFVEHNKTMMTKSKILLALVAFTAMFLQGEYVQPSESGPLVFLIVPQYNTLLKPDPTFLFAIDGCGRQFKWLWYKTIICPEEDDICVKVIETIGDEEIITRDCLSTLKGFRTDIPADKYEGCRKSSQDVKLGNYVNNSIPELDIKRDHYDSTTWCLCYFDYWCNAANLSKSSNLLIVLISIFFFVRNIYQ